MSENSHISWTDDTFNPWWGCTMVSPACLNCYAEILAWRFKKLGWGPGVPRIAASENTWNQPFVWDRKAKNTRVRRRVFCLSMGDIFDSEVPVEWRNRVWEVIRACDGLDWQLLTKRPGNILSMLPADWGDGWDHVWMGTTVEDQTRADERVPLLLNVPAKVRFLSCEPLLGEVNIPRIGELDWIIAGGESGPNFRPMEADWLRSLRDQSVNNGVAFHFKQWGTNKPTAAGRLLDGREWNEFPPTPYQPAVLMPA